MTAHATEREGLRAAQRIVVKAGSRVLVQRNGRPDLPRMRSLAAQIAALQRQGKEMVLVSSGAVGAGLDALGMKTRPSNLPDLQMAAAVGQGRLLTEYGKLFAARRCRIGQVLLTHDDLRQRSRHLNARNTLMNLLRNRIIPVVNENDVVAVDEIKVGDNDVLAALVALLIDADALVLLTVVDGLRQQAASGRTKRISHIEEVTDEVVSMTSGKSSSFSTGGMATKLEAARTVAETGISVVIANGRKPDILKEILDGRDVGTLIGTGAPRSERSVNARKRWIAYYHRAEGTLIIDEGACNAILKQGKSLLPIGIKSVIGEFVKGAVVNVKTPERLVARGLADYNSTDLRQIYGHKTSEIAGILGTKDYDEVIHRDNMVVLAQDKFET